jgi:hypothetical protein
LVVLRVWPGKLDEFLLGLLFSLIGLFLFSLGIESGLSGLGRQTGKNLPIAFMEVTSPEQARVIHPFPAESVWKAVTTDGEQVQYFYLDRGGKPTAVPFDANAYDSTSGRYVYVPRLGPLFGSEHRMTGILFALVLAFIMGYGATLAEPALNSLGRALEELSAGTLKRSFLVRTVAVGVGVGIACGFARIVWSIPLAWFLIPAYLGLIGLSLPASEELVNIAWDSAGVTTGPITVPLVISLGLGIGSQVGASESFGICALASLFPILSVLVAGQYAEHRRRQRLRQG